MHTMIKEKAKRLGWAAVIEGAEKVEVARLGKREFHVLPRLATDNIPYVRFALAGKRGAYYIALPTEVEGVFLVSSVRGGAFQGYARIVNGVLKVASSSVQSGARR